MSAARHSYGDAAGAGIDEQPRVASPVIPLLVFVVGLVAATIWFVAIPALDQPPPRRSCEVVFLKNGKTRCVEATMLRSRVHQQAKSAKQSPDH